MDNMIDYSGKLDFNEIDLTAPDKVVAEILSHLPEATNNYVSGKIEPYDGLIESISNDTFSVLAKSIGQVGQYDVQEDLGASGEESKEFECYLYTPIYEHYKFRVFFMQYNLSHYPVKLVIEKSVAQNMSNSSNYIIKCKTSFSDCGWARECGRPGR